MNGTMDCCGATDIGKARETNEDQFLIADISKSMRVHKTSLALDHQTRLFGETQGKLLLVADGMGGHEAGERASQIVIDGFVDHTLNQLSWFMYDKGENNEDFQQQLKQGLVACQRRIEREVAAIPQRRGMGSTLTLAYIVWPRMFLVHVGDSRCYLLRDGKLQQLTRDHTLAGLAASVDAENGESLDDDAIDADSPMANVLLNAIGGSGTDPHPDAQVIELAIGDTLLLCTDGLNKHLSRRQITEILSQSAKTDVICDELIRTANAGGGSDNVTVVVSRFANRDTDALEEQEVELPISESVDDTLPYTDAERLLQATETPN